jgi:asparagine synthase (glutamine-hydrolysing)
MHMARVERDSVWHILRSAVRDGLLNSPQVPLQRDCIGYSNLARDDVVEAVKAGQLFIHPWLKTEALPSPGKCWQIFGLSRPNPVYEPFAEPGDPENVEPLCSQPVVEACLRIPTYLLAARSRDRVVARQAFARDLPTEIVKRRAKGITHDYMQALLLQNIGRMREALLDGALIRERILNESKVIEALTGGPSKGAVYAPELFLCFSVESWLDTWGASARGRVAA